MDGRRLLAVAPVAHPGGAEIGLLRLLARLRSRGWDTRVATPAPGPLRDAAAAAGHATTTLALGDLHRGGGRRALSSWPRARALARESDVVYLNGSVCGRLLPAVSGAAARSVLHVHDIVARVPRLWRRADIVLTDSAAAAAPLRELDPHVVFCPVDADPPAVAAPWQPGEGPIVAFVGRLEPRKGALHLLRAYALLKPRHPQTRLIIAGRGPELGELRRFVRRTGLADVLFAGRVDDTDKARFYKTADVFCAPSTGQESFGIVLLEAMAAGTAVVASDIHGYKKVVQRNASGLLVEPKDPEAIAAAVERLIGDPALRARLGAAAAARAHEFDWKHVTEQLVAFYEEVIDARARA